MTKNFIEAVYGSLPCVLSLHSQPRGKAPAHKSGGKWQYPYTYKTAKNLRLLYPI